MEGRPKMVLASSKVNILFNKFGRYLHLVFQYFVFKHKCFSVKKVSETMSFCTSELVYLMLRRWSMSYQFSLYQPGRNQTYPCSCVIPSRYACKMLHNYQHKNNVFFSNISFLDSRIKVNLNSEFLTLYQLTTMHPRIYFPLTIRPSRSTPDWLVSRTFAGFPDATWHMT
jgi:hypothetical protein